MTASVDAAGNRTEYVYSNGRIDHIVDPFGRTTDLAWSTSQGGQQVDTLTATDWQNRDVTYTYRPRSGATPAHLEVKHTDPDGFGFAGSLIPQASETLDQRDSLYEVFVYDDDGYVIEKQKRDTPFSASPTNIQTTGITYADYLTDSNGSGLLRRVSSITNPDGSSYQINQIGQQEGLPNSDGQWWAGTTTHQQQIDRVILLTSFMVDPDNPTAAPHEIDPPDILTGIPRYDLQSFDNYATYTHSPGPTPGGTVGDVPEARTYEVTLDRRGRITHLEDPLGNFSSYKRLLAVDGLTGLVQSDKGQLLVMTAPDPDRLTVDGIVTNGPLARPETSYAYLPNSPFV
ncbi:MAG: hypothetical protein AAFN70_20795, partial [Planctomycetota bacterium]